MSDTSQNDTSPVYTIDPEREKRAAFYAEHAPVADCVGLPFPLNGTDLHIGTRKARAPEHTRPTVGYDPYRLTNEQLQLAIDNALKVIREGWIVGVPISEPGTMAALLSEHLADLLEIQRERAAGAP